MYITSIQKDLFSIRSPTAKRRKQEQEEEEEEEAGRDDRSKYRHLNSSRESMLRPSTSYTNENSQIEVPKKSYQVYNISAKEGGVSRDYSSIESQGSILVSIYNSMNVIRSNSVAARNTEQSIEMGNAWMKSPTSGTVDSNMPLTRCVTWAGKSLNEAQTFKPIKQSFNMNNQSMNQENVTNFTRPTFDTGHFSTSPSWLETTYEIEQSQRLADSSPNFQE